MLADPSVTHEMRDTFLRRRDLILKELNAIEGLRVNVPQGAFYVFPDVSSYFGKSSSEGVIKTASDLSLYLLSEAKVALVTGDAFGNPNCVRISYATSDEILLDACHRIKTALQKLH